MPEYNFSDEELDDLIKQAESELVEQMRKHQAQKQGQPLRKDDADGDGPPKKEESSPAEEASDSAPPMDGSASASAPPAPPAPGPDASASAPADPAAQGADGSAPLSVEALAAEYSQLPPEDFQMHMQAMEMAKQQMMGAGSAAASAPAAPPAAPPAPAMAPAMKGEMNQDVLTGAIPKSGPGTDHAVDKDYDPSGHPGTDHAVAKKAEFKGHAESGGQIKRGAPMGKSEGDPLAGLLAKKDAEIAELRKSYDDQFGLLTAQLEKFLGLPQQKAVTSIAAVEKPGNKLAKAEELEQLPRGLIVQSLAEVARRPDLKKSDRELINKFCVQKASVADIAHLLTDAQ